MDVGQCLLLSDKDDFHPNFGPTGLRSYVNIHCVYIYADTSILHCFTCMNKAIDQLCICVYFVSILVPYGQQGFILGAIYLSPLVDHGHNGA